MAKHKEVLFSKAENVVNKLVVEKRLEQEPGEQLLQELKDTLDATEERIDTELVRLLSLPLDVLGMPGINDVSVKQSLEAFQTRLRELKKEKQALSGSVEDKKRRVLEGADASLRWLLKKQQWDVFVDGGTLGLVDKTGKKIERAELMKAVRFVGKSEKDITKHGFVTGKPSERVVQITAALESLYTSLLKEGLVAVEHPSETSDEVSLVPPDAPPKAEVTSTKEPAPPQTSTPRIPSSEIREEREEKTVLPEFPNSKEFARLGIAEQKEILAKVEQADENTLSFIEKYNYIRELYEKASTYSAELVALVEEAYNNISAAQIDKLGKQFESLSSPSNRVRSGSSVEKDKNVILHELEKLSLRPPVETSKKAIEEIMSLGAKASAGRVEDELRSLLTNRRINPEHKKSVQELLTFLRDKKKEAFSEVEPGSRPKALEKNEPSKPETGAVAVPAADSAPSGAEAAPRETTSVRLSIENLDRLTSTIDSIVYPDGYTLDNRAKLISALILFKENTEPIVISQKERAQEKLDDIDRMIPSALLYSPESVSVPDPGRVLIEYAMKRMPFQTIDTAEEVIIGMGQTKQSKLLREVIRLLKPQAIKGTESERLLQEAEKALAVIEKPEQFNNPSNPLIGGEPSRTEEQPKRHWRNLFGLTGKRQKKDPAVDPDADVDREVFRRMQNRAFLLRGSQPAYVKPSSIEEKKEMVLEQKSGVAKIAPEKVTVVPPLVEKKQPEQNGKEKDKQPVGRAKKIIAAVMTAGALGGGAYKGYKLFEGSGEGESLPTQAGDSLASANATAVETATITRAPEARQIETKESASHNEVNLPDQYNKAEQINVGTKEKVLPDIIRQWNNAKEEVVRDTMPSAIGYARDTYLPSIQAMLTEKKLPAEFADAVLANIVVTAEEGAHSSLKDTPYSPELYQKEVMKWLQNQGKVSKWIQNDGFYLSKDFQEFKGSLLPIVMSQHIARDTINDYGRSDLYSIINPYDISPSRTAAIVVAEAVYSQSLVRKKAIDKDKLASGIHRGFKRLALMTQL